MSQDGSSEGKTVKMSLNLDPSLRNKMEEFKKVTGVDFTTVFKRGAPLFMELYKVCQNGGRILVCQGPDEDYERFLVL